MIKKLLANKGVVLALLLTALFFAVALHYLFDENYLVLLVPAAMLLVWFFMMYRDESLALMALATPFAVDYALIGNMSLSMPVEPMMIVFTVVFLFQELLMRSYDKRVLRHPVSILIMLSLVWMVFTSIVSLKPVESFKYTAVRLWFVIPFFYATAQSFQKVRHIRLFYWAYALSLSVVVVITTVKTMQRFGELQMLHHVMQPFYNDHTAYGCIIALMLPLAAYFALEPRTRLWKRIVAVSLTVLLLVGLGLSYCRAAWVSVVGAIAVYLLVRLGVRMRWLVISAALLLGLFFAFQDDIMYELGKNKQDSSFTLADQVKSISNISTDASNLERLNRWNAAFRMWKDQPLTGIGPGAYQFIYGPYQRSDMMTIISTNDGDMGNAHSEYIGPLTEQGVPGALLMLAIFVATFVTGERVYRTAVDRRKGHLALVLAVSLFTYYVHGIMNNFLDTDKLSVPFWALTAAIVAIDIVTEKKPQGR
ncbi:MAG: O-antigen ligase family protein [Bacteroidales bacterium]|nr:O-antigen ligase family protein [Bacteroidales bacterium]